MTHAQRIYMDSRTLKHHIYLDVVGDIVEYDGLLTAADGLKEAGQWTKDFGDNDIGLYIFLTNTMGGGAAGMAFLGGLCAAKKWGTSINTGPKRGVLNTVDTLVHEVGHNLGMPHDFIGKKKEKRCRKSSDNSEINCAECSGFGYNDNGEVEECCTGFLDYFNHP